MDKEESQESVPRLDAERKPKVFLCTVWLMDVFIQFWVEERQRTCLLWCSVYFQLTILTGEMPPAALSTDQLFQFCWFHPQLPAFTISLDTDTASKVTDYPWHSLPFQTSQVRYNRPCQSLKTSYFKVSHMNAASDEKKSRVGCKSKHKRVTKLGLNWFTKSTEYKLLIWGFMFYFYSVINLIWISLTERKKEILRTKGLNWGGEGRKKGRKKEERDKSMNKQMYECMVETCWVTGWLAGSCD